MIRTTQFKLDIGRLISCVTSNREFHVEKDVSDVNNASCRHLPPVSLYKFLKMDLVYQPLIVPTRSPRSETPTAVRRSSGIA